MRSVVYASEVPTSLDEAIAHVAPGGTVVVDIPCTTDHPIAIPSGLTLRGLEGASISHTGTFGAVLEFQAAVNCTVENLALVGGEGGVKGWQCKNSTVRNCVIQCSQRRGLEFYGPDSDNLRISNNRIESLAVGALNGIFVQDTGRSLVIESNYLNTTNANDHGLAVHTWQTDGTVQGVRVTDNRIDHWGPNFAIEIGQFGTGDIVLAALVARNYIRLNARTNGGISMSGVFGSSVEQNLVDINGQGINIFAIEIVNARYCTVAANVVMSGLANAPAVILDSASDCLVYSNYLGGYVNVNNSGTHPGNLELSRNQITHNLVRIPDGSTNPNVFWMQVNVPDCRAIANMLVGNTASAPPGVQLGYLQVDHGTAESTVVDANVLETRAA